MEIEVRIVFSNFVIGVARILSGRVHVFPSKKLTTFLVVAFKTVKKY